MKNIKEVDMNIDREKEKKFDKSTIYDYICTYIQRCINVIENNNYNTKNKLTRRKTKNWEGNKKHFLILSKLSK